MVKVFGLEHIGICVRDMDRSLDFYCRVLRMEKLGERTIEGEEAESLAQKKGASVRIAILGSRIMGKIELMQFVPEGDIQERQMKLTDAGRIVELAVRVSGLNELLEDIQKLGYESFSEPMEISLGSLGKSRIAYIRDPDNILVELIENVREER